MADLAAGDVTYTLSNPTVSNFSRKSVHATLVFGDGAKTYPTGGVPISGGSLGLPNSIFSVRIFDQGSSGYHFSYDTVNSKIRMFQRDAHNHGVFLKNADQADAAGNRVNAATNKLGANTGSNISVAGSDGATAGGVINAAAAPLSELTNSIAPAAVTIVVEASGY